MKKLLMILTVISLLALSLFADENNSASGPERTEGKWTEISYVNVPVLKILEGKEGYAVIYQKNKTSISLFVKSVVRLVILNLYLS